jgi:hypothetical protein
MYDRKRNAYARAYLSNRAYAIPRLERGGGIMRTNMQTISWPVMIGAFCVWTLIGCDDRRTLVPLEPTTAPATQPAAPTTQDLLSGQQQRLSLRSIPFWINVPRGWELKSQAGVVLLQGPTPSGVAQLQVGRHMAPIENHAQNLIIGAKREAAAHPSEYALAEVRDNNGIKTLETRSVGATQNAPAIDAGGNTIAPTMTPLEWKTTMFIPDGRDTIVCDIHFVDLSREQYDRDKQLLTKIMSSLQYDPKANNN